MQFTRAWTEEEDDFLRQNYLEMPYDHIASKLNRSNRAIRLRRMALGLEPKYKRVPVNEHFFDSIDTPLKSYLLGLLAGDGWVGQRLPYSFGLCLRLKDTDEVLVELLRDSLSPGKNIYHSANQAALSITLSPHLFSILSDKYGIVPHRKPNYNIPPSIPRNLLPDFILGYFDADGSLSRTKRGHFVWSLCGGKLFLQEVASLFKFELDIPVLPQKYARSDWLHYLWLYSLKNICKVDAWIHQSGLGLQRKRLSAYLPSTAP